MALQLSNWSRFRTTESVLYDGKETFGRWNPPGILTQNLPRNKLIVIKVNNVLEGRPDLISLAYYGTTLLDWLIIAYNNASGALNWPRAGQVISFPTERAVMDQL